MSNEVIKVRFEADTTELDSRLDASIKKIERMQKLADRLYGVCFILKVVLFTAVVTAMLTISTLALHELL